MTKILVTGATGSLGRQTLLRLLDRRPAHDLIGLARDPAKAADLAARGVELRPGDYLDRASLSRALTGVDKVMLTSAVAFTDRNTSHANVIDAAFEAGVKQLVFMPIHRRPGATFSMPQITAEDAFTVQRLRDSGLAYTLAEHPPFLDSLPFFLGGSPAAEVRITAGSGTFRPATRDDLATAHATLLTEDGHAGKRYALMGAPAASFADVAELMGVPYVPVSREQYFDHFQRATGLPDAVVEFACTWVDGMTAGEWADASGGLERLIGRPPTTVAEYVRGATRPPAPMAPSSSGGDRASP